MELEVRDARRGELDDQRERVIEQWRDFALAAEIEQPAIEQPLALPLRNVARRLVDHVLALPCRLDRSQAFPTSPKHRTLSGSIPGCRTRIDESWCSVEHRDGSQLAPRVVQATRQGEGMWAFYALMFFAVSVVVLAMDPDRSGGRFLGRGRPGGERGSSSCRCPRSSRCRERAPS
jgi:hypothetical protein